jgi:hypothetical protein
VNEEALDQWGAVAAKTNKQTNKEVGTQSRCMKMKKAKTKFLFEKFQERKYELTLWGRILLQT